MVSIYWTHLENCIKALGKSIKVCTWFPKTFPGNFTLSELSTKDLGAQEGKNSKKKEKKNKKRDNSFNRVYQRPK